MGFPQLKNKPNDLRKRYSTKLHVQIIHFPFNFSNRVTRNTLGAFKKVPVVGF